MKRKAIRFIRNFFLIFAALWVVILVVLQIVLTPAVLTKAVNRYSSAFVDGNVSFGRVEASVFRSFPYLNVNIDSLSVTYPSDRFEGSASAGDWFGRQGKGNGADTLMSFSRFTASVNMLSLLTGTVSLPETKLYEPRVFAFRYSGNDASWDIFRFSSGSDTTSSSGEMPHVVIGKVHLENNPHIVFCSVPDTVSAALNVRRMTLDGKFDSRAPRRNRMQFNIDTMLFACRLPSDTMSVRLDRFEVEGKKGGIDVRAKATAWLAMHSYGRMKIPVDMQGRVSFPQGDLSSVNLERFRATVAAIPLEASGQFIVRKDSLYVNASASVDRCKVSGPLSYFGKNIWKAASDLKTDAVISLSADVDGWLDTKGSLPDIGAFLEIPESVISHKAIGVNNILSVRASLETDTSGRVNVDLENTGVKGRGVDLSLAGRIADIFGKDPVFSIDAKAGLDLDTLSVLLEKGLQCAAAGKVSAEIKGDILKSQLVPYGFAEADLKGFLKSPGLYVSSRADSLDIYVDSLDLRLFTIGNTEDPALEKDERMLALSGGIDSLSLVYRDAVSVAGRNISLKAQNSAAILDESDSSSFFPFGGKFDAGYLFVRGADNAVAGIVNSSNIFRLVPYKGNRNVPELTLESRTGTVFARSGLDRAGVSDLYFSGKAAMNTVEKSRIARRILDSLSRACPDVPSDSLVSFILKRRVPSALPDWLSEDDFRSRDIEFNLGKEFRRYLRDWDIDGRLSMAGMSFISPRFPLKNRIGGFDGRFSNDEIALEGCHLKSGSSDLHIRGRIDGIRRAFLHHGILDVDVDVSSDSLDFNELFSAYAAGRSLREDGFDAGDFSGLEDSEYEDIVLADSGDTVITSGLVVIPANIRADISLKASDVRYSTLEMTGFESDLAIAERCIRFTNTSASSNVGNLSFEGFYSSRTKKDIKTGFNMAFSEITAEKVVEMIPAIDSIMPMLKSFSGKLDFEMAATADLDTLMNIEMPSVNGIVRISGENLRIKSENNIRKLAKILKFKDKDNVQIDRMKVESMIADSRLEVFPFLLDVDRYELAMSGIQNLDSSFKYHISVLQSPLVFRFGVDIWGNFDDFDFRIGKAKYKNADLPVFTAAVDQTKLNLSKSIRDIFSKGVDEAVSRNRRQNAIAAFKNNIGYVQAVDEKLDSLSAEQKNLLE